MPLTSAQIVTNSCAIAKCPGYVVQGGQYLNQALYDLCTKRNLKVNLVTETLSLPANSFGPFNFPTNYLRTYDMFYYVSGTPYFLEPASLREYDEENKISGIQSYPYEWASDLSAVAGGGNGIFYMYPQSSTQLAVTHRYYLKQPDISNPQTSNAIPWFPDQDILETMVAAKLMKITDDDRREQFLADVERMLEPYLMMAADDEQQVTKEVRLDPRRFHVSGSNRPTKLDPF